MQTTFTTLNHGWNAEPNAPDEEVTVVGSDVRLRFFMNPFRYPEYAEGDVGILVFSGCSQWRHGRTNDEGWYMGQCRFSGIAPAWGDFFELAGDLLLDSPKAPKDWQIIGPPAGRTKHFLFYLRDATFECDAESWTLDLVRAPATAP